ncbi:MAG TPA: class I SAM-dependent methyltransferase [Rhizomicrobium sp.]|nr:class I SAM-dependent methyltransferase [Rhizomicrobium sp.]
MATSRTQQLAFAGLQTARVAFYGVHYLAARLAARDSFGVLQKTEHPVPSLAAMARAMAELFAQDWRNVEAGLYPAPLNILKEARRAMASIDYLRDIPRVVKRQQSHGHSEAMAKGEGKPRYYRQNFHYQTDGYLSDDSAKIYDFQVESLFAGTAEAMRRCAYVPVAKYLEARDPAKTTLLDIGAGTGRFLSFVKSVQPELKVTALDLSGPYLSRAKRALRHAKGAAFIEAPAEAIPLRDASVDIAVSIYLFHELPPKIRAAGAKEIARVLKPGGVFILADTIQYGDAPEFDGLIDVFPELLHEPYYKSYAQTDLKKLFAPLRHASDDIAYLTKISVFEKPARKRR